MSLFKRVILCIKRKFAQNMLLFLVILLLGILTSGAISIGRAIERTEDNVWRQLPAVAMIEEDWFATELYWREYGTWPAPPITVEMVEQVASLPYVRDVEISLETTLYSRGLNHYREGSRVTSLQFWGVSNIEKFSVKGVSDPEFLELSIEMIEITSGSTFTAEQIEMGIPVIMISREFAQENNLTVGSFITLESIVTKGIDDYTESWFEEDNIFDSLEIDFEVIGIYEVPELAGGDINAEFERIGLLNSSFVPYTVISKMINFYFESANEYWYSQEGFALINIEEALDFSHYFLLNDARDLPAFRRSALALLPEFITVTDVSDSFSDVIISMENVRDLSTIVLVLAIGSSVIVLSLVITLLIRDRKHEIGIYLSLGEHKKKIALQFLLEIMLITLIASSLSLFIGSFLSSNLSQNMLLQELSSIQDKNVGNENHLVIGNSILTDNREILRFAPDPLSPEELIDLFDTSIDSREVLTFYGVAIITVMVSTIVPVAYVMRLEPKEILL